MRGDVPNPAHPLWHYGEFSPRARGCSPLWGPSDTDTQVFPACAGMFPDHVTLADLVNGFPRVRGDVPFRISRVRLVRPFSPRARGCSQSQIRNSLALQVFPACAGMFPIERLQPFFHHGFPRVRGDVPWGDCSGAISALFSPRARGCSFDFPINLATIEVFPACAGMFRVRRRGNRPRRRFPRVRGDVPTHRATARGRCRFSPRARGCSHHTRNQTCYINVFPACAGMFRIRRRTYHPRRGFPRVRGDVPT